MTEKSTPDEETKKALREFLDEVDRVIAEELPADAVERRLWKVYRDAGFTPICVHCGDWTEPLEDPSPTLCAMCALVYPPSPPTANARRSAAG